MKRIIVVLMSLVLLATACEGNVFSLSAGDCFNDPSTTEEVSDVEIVECGELHDNEVYATYDISGSEFPGQSVVSQNADDGCLSRFAPYVGVDYYESSLGISYLTPSSASWSGGDREVICFTYDLSGNSLTTSVRGTGI